MFSERFSGRCASTCGPYAWLVRRADLASLSEPTIALLLSRVRTCALAPGREDGVLTCDIDRSMAKLVDGWQGSIVLALFLFVCFKRAGPLGLRAKRRARGRARMDAAGASKLRELERGGNLLKPIF